MQFKLLSICFAIALFTFAGCKKEAGEGGTGVITGKVYINDYQNGSLVGQHYAPDERVYIMYGDNTIYNDDMDTHYDGSYSFNYLYPGSYTLYCYSDCNTCASGTEPIMKTVEISQEGEIVQADDIIIKKGGTGVITGKVYVNDYQNGFLTASYYGPDERVYIMYGNNTIHFYPF